jgi:hypothetical protein
MKQYYRHATILQCDPARLCWALLKGFSLSRQDHYDFSLVIATTAQARGMRCATFMYKINPQVSGKHEACYMLTV